MGLGDQVENMEGGYYLIAVRASLDPLHLYIIHAVFVGTNMMPDSAFLRYSPCSLSRSCVLPLTFMLLWIAFTWMRLNLFDGQCAACVAAPVIASNRRVWSLAIAATKQASECSYQFLLEQNVISISR
jgi:hypothetical protein